METQEFYPISIDDFNEMFNHCVEHNYGYRDTCVHVSSVVMFNMIRIHKLYPPMEVDEYTYVNNRLCEITYDALENSKTISEILIPIYKK